MIGLLLIYFIGKAFYDLAGLNDKSEWGYAILGIVTYYAGTYIAGLAIGVFIELGLSGSLTDVPTRVLGFLVIPFGLLACWGTYSLLKKRWSRTASRKNDEVLDQNLVE
jgi:hypothetical protein